MKQESEHIRQVFNIAGQIEQGRKLLYETEFGLYDRAKSLLSRGSVNNATGVTELLLSSHDTGLRLELYLSRSGGLAIKQTVALERVNTEELTLTVPSGGFVSPEHTLNRARAGSGSTLYKPPVVYSPNAGFRANEEDYVAMNDYLGQYIPVAHAMRTRLERFQES